MKIRTILCFLLITSIMHSSAFAADYVNKSAEGTVLPFEDVNEDCPYYDAIKYVYEKGWMKGCSEALFQPNANANRLMPIIVIWRMDDTPVHLCEPDSLDPEVPYWTEVIEWAKDVGIINGYGKNTLGLKDELTNEQLCVMLWRYAKITQVDLDAYSAEGLPKIKDINSISDYAVQAMNWALALGIIECDDNGCVNPKEKVSRGELADRIMKFDQATEGRIKWSWA